MVKRFVIRTFSQAVSGNRRIVITNEMIEAGAGEILEYPNRNPYEQAVAVFLAMGDAVWDAHSRLDQDAFQNPAVDLILLD